MWRRWKAGYSIREICQVFERDSDEHLREDAQERAAHLRYGSLTLDQSREAMASLNISCRLRTGARRNPWTPNAKAKNSLDTQPATSQQTARERYLGVVLSAEKMLQVRMNKCDSRRQWLRVPTFVSKPACYESMVRSRGGGIFYSASHKTRRVLIHKVHVAPLHTAR